MDLVVSELSKYLEEEELEIKKLEEEKLQDFPDVLGMVYDFEAASESRMWMRQILINQAREETDDDEEITEEEYKHMLKMHKMEQRIKLSVESDPTTNRFKYYSSDILTHENKWPSHYKTFKIKKKKSKSSSKDVKVVKHESKDMGVLPDLTMDVPLAAGTVKSEDLPDSNVPSEKSVVKKRKVDVDVLRKRIWRFIARKEIPKAYRQKCQLKATSFLSSRKFCKEIIRKGRCNAVASQKYCKETVSRARRLSRETQMFWKRYNKVEKTHRKKAEKHALEQRKLDEGIREAKRQQRKLNFLISQTELFAHFLSKKINQNAEIEQNYNERKQKILSALTDDFAESTYAIESLGGHGNADVAKLEAEAIKEQALKTVEDALRLHRNMQQDFEPNEADEKIPEDVIEAKSLSQPTIFQGTLKTYQVKGMSWLVNLYQQGISGILADEMGLGKTVQTIAFLGHLAESIGIWGPFLVIAPASTLNNWHQEFTRFLPDFKVLPYWGNPNDRKVLRKFWSQATTCTDKETAPFHVLVTSYQLVISDVRCFQRVKWQFMVLDEAQALKSSTSARWKTLLEFQCRNRLLLTGTPIQNTMAELWALLHFIMPSLFDSHNEFSEWFSKDIENHIENKSSIDEKQLSRLHLILKPFMLRRIKKDVENELSEKIEVRVNCSMTPRQCRLYKALQQNLKLEDLLRTAGNSSSAPGNTTLMNLVMQFRKTCNHPDLFERREVVSSIQFKMPILSVPKLVFHEGFLFKLNPTRKKLLYHDLNIHSQCNIFELKDQGHSLLSFIDFWDISYTDYCNILRNSFIGRLKALHNEIKQQIEIQSLRTNGIATKNKMVLNNLLVRKHHICFTNTNNPVYQVSTGCDMNLCEAVKVPKFYLDLYLPRVLCNPCNIYCNDRAATTYFTECKTRSGRFIQDTVICLFGVDLFNNLMQSEHTNPWLKWNNVATSTKASGFFHNPLVNSGLSCLAENWSKICIPSKEYLVSDSGKMFALDFLLKRLKMENHRVLIYSQMTKMIDLLEEYMLYRKHTYIRLDGSSRISDRRDMVADFQKRDDIFVFLLSTRAGGLGINLTAADTVIFYDSDWNPTVDQQAMDRAHRLGQTKQVTVYRLVCQGTVDERILQRAEEKNIIQKMVISGGHFKQENLKTKEVVSLLLDDEQMIKKWNANKDEVKKQQYKGKKRGRKSNAEKEMEQAKRMKALQRDSPLLEDISAPTSAEPTPVPSPQSSSSQDAFMQDEDSIIVVDDDDLAPSPRITPKPRGRGRGRPRIRPIQAESSKKRGSRNAGRARGTASNRRGRKPVRGRAAEIAGARAGAVAASAAAYATYGYQYQAGNYNPDSNQQ